MRNHEHSDACVPVGANAYIIVLYRDCAVCPGARQSLRACTFYSVLLSAWCTTFGPQLGSGQWELAEAGYTVPPMSVASAVV